MRGASIRPSSHLVINEAVERRDRPHGRWWRRGAGRVAAVCVAAVFTSASAANANTPRHAADADAADAAAAGVRGWRRRHRAREESKDAGIFRHAERREEGSHSVVVHDVAVGSVR